MNEVPAIDVDAESAGAETETETETESPIEQPEPTIDQPEPKDDDDVNEETVDLTDDDLGGGLFSGVDDAGDDDSALDPEAASDDVSGSEAEDDGEVADVMDGLEGNAAALEGAINDGIARLAVVGLTDDDFEDSSLTKSSLEDEFAETFQAFRLGHFGSLVIEEYVLEPADGDVSPAWGLFGSMLMATAMIVWLRPDGDRAVEKARDTVGNIAGGLP